MWRRGVVIVAMLVGCLPVSACRHHEAPLTIEPQAWWPMNVADVPESVRQELYELAEEYLPYDSTTHSRLLLENDSLYTVYLTPRSKTRYGDSHGVVFAKNGLRFKIVFGEQ